MNPPLIANINIYYSTTAPFYYIRVKERAKYATLLHCRARQKYGLKEERQNGRTKLYFFSGIINPLFDGLTYNTSGHFAHCSYFPTPLRARKNTTQLPKYPRVLYNKQSNKACLFPNIYLSPPRMLSPENASKLKIHMKKLPQ